MEEKNKRGAVLRTWPDGHMLKKVKEVADLFDVHANTLYRWVADGEIECSRMPGNTIMFTYDQVQAFINSRRERGTINYIHPDVA